MAQILLVEDIEDLILVTKRALEPEHHVTGCQSLKAAEELLKSNKFDLILLDVGLPDGNGFEFLSAMKFLPNFSATPVLMMTASSSITDQVLGFTLGAEDYIIKPIHPSLLVARVNSKLKKSTLTKAEGEVFSYGELKFDILKQKLNIIKEPHEEEVSLTPIEFKLLLYLAKNTEQIHSRKQLMDTVWGKSVHVYGRTVDTHISHIRTKIKASSFTIEAVSSLGYRLVRKS